MSEEHTQGTAVATIPRANIQAGGAVVGFVPQTLDEAYRLANIILRGGFAPKGLESPEAVLVAILHGADIGMKPFVAIKNIAVINNRPVLWGDGLMALVESSGLLEDIEESIAGEGDTLVATCKLKRKGRSPQVRTFSAVDAKKAGVWTKSGPWSQYPKRMLQVRAKSFALRDVFPDVLAGLYIREEVEDYEPEARDITPPTPEPPPADAPVPVVRRGRTRTEAAAKEGPGKRDAAAYVEPATEEAPPAAEEAPAVEDAQITEEAPAAEEATAESPLSDEDLIEEMTEAFAKATTLEELSNAWDRHEDVLDGRGREIEQKITELYQKRGKALQEPPAETEEARVQRLKTASKAGMDAYQRGRSLKLGPQPPHKGVADEEESWVKGWKYAESLPKQAAEGNAAPAAASTAATNAPASVPSADEPPTASLHEEQLFDIAYQAGREAKRKGMSSRAYPGDYRLDARAAELKAWKEGYADESAGN